MLKGIFEGILRILATVPPNFSGSQLCQ